MRVVMTGGTGFIGPPLCGALIAAGHTVTILTRRALEARRLLPPSVSVVTWDSKTLDPVPSAIESADGIVNLAGASIGNGRWTPERKAMLRSSRLESTSALVHAMERATRRPSVFVSQSAVGYYGDCGDQVVTESHGPGSDFLAQLCVDWEAAALEAEKLGVRVVTPRTAVVLGRGGGALAPLLTPFRMFVGGPLGSGRQWFPWVHLDDVIGLVRFALDRDDLHGPLNVAGPEAVTMNTFARELGSALHRPSLLPAPGFALRLLLGEFAETLLGGQRVVPSVARDLGYPFKYPKLATALRAAVGDETG